MEDKIADSGSITLDCIQFAGLLRQLISSHVSSIALKTLPKVDYLVPRYSVESLSPLDLKILTHGGQGGPILIAREPHPQETHLLHLLVGKKYIPTRWTYILLVSSLWYGSGTEIGARGGDADFGSDDTEDRSAHTLTLLSAVE